jgi:predicted transcriptional regulator
VALKAEVPPKPTGETETEAAIREGILRGLADAEAGRVVPHDVAMRHIRQVIARVRSESLSAPVREPETE